MNQLFIEHETKPAIKTSLRDERFGYMMAEDKCYVFTWGGTSAGSKRNYLL